MTLRRELDDAQEEVGRVREVLRSEGIFEPVSSSQEDTWRAAESSISLSRGGSRRSAPSPEEMLRTVKSHRTMRSSLVAGLKMLFRSAGLGRSGIRRRARTYPVEADITSLWVAVSPGYAVAPQRIRFGLRSALSARQPTGGQGCRVDGATPGRHRSGYELRLFTVMFQVGARSVRRSYAATSSPALATPE